MGVCTIPLETGIALELCTTPSEREFALGSCATSLKRGFHWASTQPSLKSTMKRGCLWEERILIHLKDQNHLNQNGVCLKRNG